MHRDISAENILITEQRRVKIGDFGVSKQLSQKTIQAKTHIGRELYKSPEIYQGETYTKMTDIWSAGILFYYMLEGKFPFEELNLLKLVTFIIKDDPPKFTKQINPLYEKIIFKMLEKDPINRPTMD